MNIFKKMLGSFFTSPRNVSLDSTAGWYDGLMSQSGISVTEKNVLGLSTAWRCISLLAGTTASLPIKVYKKTNKGVAEEYSTHQIYSILHDEPNYDQTAFDFWHFMICALEMRGNCYARISRNGANKIISLTPINPSNISVRRLTDGSLHYSWTEEGTAYEGNEKDVFHVRGFGGNALGGLSPLSVCRNVFGNAIAADGTSGDMFRNGLRPSGVLEFGAWLTDEQRKVAEDKLASKIGVNNGGKPLILEGGTKWSQITLTPEDAQMLQSRAFSVEEICRLFGVPPHMVGHTEKTTSWGSGLEQQTLAFVQYTLRERLKRIEQAINKQLLTRQERQSGIYVQFTLEGLLRGDSKGRSEFYKTMTQIGAMTINEVRCLENLQPVDGGDIPRVQMQNVPINEADSDAMRETIQQIQQES